MAKIVIAELDINVEALIKSTSEVKKVIDALKISQSELAKSGDTNSKQFVENAANLKVLNSEYNSGIKAISDNTKAIADQTNRTDLLNLALEQEVTSINEARESNKILNKLRNEATTSLGEQSQEVLDLNAKLDANNEFIKANADAYLKQKINIGNYSDSIKDALSNLNPLNGGLAGFVQRSNEAGGAGNLVKSSLGGMATGFVGVAKASIAFIATPIGAFITALVVVFGAIKAAMDRSSESTAKITKIFAVFSGITNVLLKAVSVLGDYWINSYVKILDKVGDATEKVMRGIASALKFLGFDDAAKSVDGFTDSTKASIKASTDLANAEKQLEKEQRKARLTQLQYQKEAEQFRQIRDDENKTIAERIKANEDLGLVLKRQLKDELAIAQLALNIANARIKAEGSTSALLDAQADALTQIADIQERVTGQESEQLVNRVSLQKQAASKQKEIQDKAQADREAATARANELIDKSIEKSKVELDFFIESQGIKAKSLEDELKLAEEVRDKRLAILSTELKNNRITQSQFNLESLKEKNVFLLKQAEVTSLNAQQELKEFIEVNKSKIDANKFLTDEIVNEEISRLGSIGEAQKVAEEAKIQSKLEYENAILAIEAETKAKQDAILNEQLAMEAEKKAIDQENIIAAKESEFEQRQLDLDRAKQQELDAAEKSGADIGLINAKYAALQKQLDQDLLNNKLNNYKSTFGMIQGLFKEGTTVAKAAAIAQIGIDTFQAAQKLFNIGAIETALALASTAILDLRGAAQHGLAATVAYVQGGVTIAGGVAQSAKVAGIKFEKGGIQEVGGNRHAQGGTKFYGEDGTTFEAEKGEGIGVMNRGAFSAFMDFNNSFNGGKSTPTFMQGGGIITQGVQMQSGGLDASQIIEMIASLPPPMVAVTDINRESNNYARVVNGADF